MAMHAMPYLKALEGSFHFRVPIKESKYGL